MKASKVLLEARQGLEQRGWVQYIDGGRIGNGNCGALGFIDSDIFETCLKYLWTATGKRCIAEWNDAPERTLTDVLDAYDHAIKLAKEDEALEAESA